MGAVAFKRTIVTLAVLALTGFAVTSPAVAVDPGFPAPTGDPSIIPPGARVDRIWDGGCTLTEGVAAAHDGMIYFSDITFTKFCKDPLGKFLQAGNIWKYDPKTGEAMIYRSPSGMSNGLKFDREGNLIAALGADYGGRMLIIDSRINNGMIRGLPEHAMSHETFRESRATGEAPACGSATPAGWADTVGGGSAGPRFGEFGLSMVARVSTRRPARAGCQADTRSAPWLVPRPERPAGAPAGEGPAPGGVHDRSLDPGARRQADPAGVRDSLSPGPRVEAADWVGLELPEAGAPRPGAGRGRHRALDAHGMAADKKTPLGEAPTSSSSMRAAFCSSPMSVAPGPPKGRPRVCFTDTGTIASRSAAAWRSHPNGAGSPSTFAVARAISRVSTSGPFCSICSDTFA